MVDELLHAGSMPLDLGVGEPVDTIQGNIVMRGGLFRVAKFPLHVSSCLATRKNMFRTYLPNEALIPEQGAQDDQIWLPSWIQSCGVHSRYHDLGDPLLKRQWAEFACFPPVYRFIIYHSKAAQMTP
jgi:hypothetical protein